MQETRVGSLGQEDPLEKEMVTRSGIFAWEIPRTEELAVYDSGDHRVRHNLSTKQQTCYSLLPYLKSFNHV